MGLVSIIYSLDPRYKPWAQYYFPDRSDKTLDHSLYIRQRNLFYKMQLSTNVNFTFYKGRPDGTWIPNMFFEPKIETVSYNKVVLMGLRRL